uniref:Eukaryotic translation initiation factor 5 n=1 Tax=Rhabditophanes sp. KR3021 TaxID=114890 RepID=A0AC35U2A1_9BILA
MASRNNINVNRSVIDPYYRYKMPKLQAKVEGKGNGIKTVISNMTEIAKSLERPPMYPTKYFGCELGAQTNFDNKNERYIVNGDHDATKLQDLLDGFIKKFVLCANCENPETTFTIKRGTIHSKCKACGHSSIVDPTHKLSTYILKNPPSSDDDSYKKENAPNGSPTEDKNSDSFEFDEQKIKEIEDDDNWAPEPVECDTNVSAAIGKLIISADLDKSIEERLDMLYEFMKKAKADGTITKGKLIADEADRLELKVKAPLLLAEVLFDTNILKQLGEYKVLLQTLCVREKKAQRYLLGGIEQVIFHFKDVLLPKSAHIIKALYDLDICEEDNILAWGEKPSKKYVSKEFSASILEKAKPVLEWLKNADVETSEEESDDEIEFNDRAQHGNKQPAPTNGSSNGNHAVSSTANGSSDGEEIDIDDI